MNYLNNNNKQTVICLCKNGTNLLDDLIYDRFIGIKMNNQTIEFLLSIITEAWPIVTPITTLYRKSSVLMLISDQSIINNNNNDWKK